MRVYNIERKGDIETFETVTVDEPSTARKAIVVFATKYFGKGYTLRVVSMDYVGTHLVRLEGGVSSRTTCWI